MTQKTACHPALPYATCNEEETLQDAIVNWMATRQIDPWVRGCEFDVKKKLTWHPGHRTPVHGHPCPRRTATGCHTFRLVTGTA